MVESGARLINLYDDSKLGVLSEHQFWGSLRELAFITGIEINQHKANLNESSQAFRIFM